MILITGANGHFGKSAIDFLLKKGISSTSITGMVRDQSKASDLVKKRILIRTGDYNDYNSLVEAFKGIDKLLFISGSEIVNRHQQHEHVVKAAKEAHVKHIVYTSFERKNERETSPIYMVSASHLFTEKIIKESGIPFTIMRNNLYMEGLPMFMGEKVLETGIFFPAGNTKAAYTLRKDMAEAAANILVENGHENKVYYISNTESVSFKEIARLLSDITGREIHYTSPDIKTFSETLKNAGIPDVYIGVSVGFAEGIKQGEFLPVRTDLKELLGRKPTTMREFLKSVYGSEG